MKRLIVFIAIIFGTHLCFWNSFMFQPGTFLDFRVYESGG